MEAFLTPRVWREMDKTTSGLAELGALWHGFRGWRQGDQQQGSLLVRQFAVHLWFWMGTKRVPRAHNLACLINYCAGLCFRQFHITQQLNQEPKPHHQDPQRASCHLVTHQHRAVLPFTASGGTQILATISHLRTEGWVNLSTIKKTCQPSPTAVTNRQFLTFTVLGQSSLKYCI